MIETLKLVLLGFASSFGFAIVFHIDRKNLVIAGLGGALTRLVYIILGQLTNETFLVCLFSAMFASLYAEIQAMRQRMPSTVFLYPAILPLVPGSLLYYIAVNIVLGDTQAAWDYAGECALTVGGIGFGFVLISTFTYYRRIYRVGEHIEGKLRRGVRNILNKITGKKEQTRIENKTGENQKEDDQKEEVQQKEEFQKEENAALTKEKDMECATEKDEKSK